MKIEPLNDTAIMVELGLRLAQARLDRNLTQEELAIAAFVSKRTIERLETGKSVQLNNLVRVLSALHLAQNLEQVAPPVGARPIEQLKRQSKNRRRASPSKEGSATAWTWDDTK